MIFLRLSLWTRGMQLWQRRRKTFEKKKKYAQCPRKVNKNSSFHKKNIYISWKSSHGQVERSLDNSAGKLLPAAQNLICSTSENDRKKAVPSKKTLLQLNLFLWTCRMQFWQAGQKTPRKGQKLFAHCPKTIKKRW